MDKHSRDSCSLSCLFTGLLLVLLPFSLPIFSFSIHPLSNAFCYSNLFLSSFMFVSYGIPHMFLSLDCFPLIRYLLYP